jgi:hypothetical protein
MYSPDTVRPNKYGSMVVFFTCNSAAGLIVAAAAATPGIAAAQAGAGRPAGGAGAQRPSQPISRPPGGGTGNRPPNGTPARPAAKVAPNSPGATLLNNYELTQTPCGPNGLVVIFGPDDSVICAQPNHLVHAAAYDLDAQQLSIVSR